MAHDRVLQGFGRLPYAFLCRTFDREVIHVDRGARELQNNVLAKREKTGSFLGVKMGRRLRMAPSGYY
jgi:hypothetical protein